MLLLAFAVYVAWLWLSNIQYSFIILKFYLLLFGGWLLYNIVLVSAIHPHELAIGIHMSPLSWISLPPATTLGCPEPQVWAPCVIRQISPGSLILHTIVYIFQCNSLSSSHPHPSSGSLFSMSASPLMPYREVRSSVPPFQIACICVNKQYLP